MKKITLLVLALSLSSALACGQLKPGTIGGGLLPTPAGARLTCGPLYQAFTQNMSATNARSTELYLIDAASAERIGGAFGTTLQRRGYTLIQQKDLGGSIRGKLFGWVNADTGDVVVVTIGSLGGQIFMAVLRQ